MPKIFGRKIDLPKIFSPKAKDWLDAYLADEYGTDVPDVEVLFPAPEHFTEKDLDAELRHAIQTTAIPVRQRVGQVTGGAVPEGREVRGPAYFQSLVERDSDLSNAFTSLTMVIGLLRDSYKNQRPGESVAEHAGFDQANLHTVLKGLFSAVKGNVIEQKKVVAYLTKVGWSVKQILYYDILGLTDHSSEAEINFKCEQFKRQADRLDQLLEYAPVENVNQLLRARKDPQNAAVPTADLVAQFGFSADAPVRFDEDAANSMLAETRERQTEAYYSAFCQANRTMPALAMLQNMATTFGARDEEYTARYQQAYFNGHSVEEVVRELDGLFPEVPGMGRELLAASVSGGNVQALVRRINERCKFKNPQELQAKLAEFHQAVGRRYPGLLVQGDPLKQELEEAGKPEIDFTTFWQEVKTDPEISRVYHQLHHLHFALRRTDEQYDAKNRHQHFEGEDRNAVLANLNGVLGYDLMAAMQTAADMGNEVPYQHYALIEAIAKHGNCVKNPDRLKRELCRIGTALNDLYPALGA